MMNFTVSGELVARMLLMMALTHTDLPEPVVPAISRCGICVKSAEIGRPSTDMPSAIASGDLIFRKLSDSIISRRLTSAAFGFGTSTPT